MNKIDLSNLLADEKKNKKEAKKEIKVERKKTFSCPHSNCSVEFAYEQHLKEHILNKHNKLKASIEKIIEISPIINNPSVKKVKPKKPKIYHCTYKNCKKKFSLEMALNQHIEDKHMKSKLIEKKKKVTKTFTVTKKIDDIDFLKERIISINTTLSITVDRIIHDEILEDTDNIRVLSFTNISDSQKSMYQMIKEYYGKLLVIEKNNSSLKKIINIKCPFCESLLFSKKSLEYHVKNNHKEYLLTFLYKNGISKTYCKYCDELILDKLFEKHYKKCSKMTCEYCEENLCKDDYEEHLSQCLKYKEKFWEENSSIKEIKEKKTTLTNIEKHQAIEHQFREDEELDPDLIDEKSYQKTFGIQLDKKAQSVGDRVTFEHAKVYYKEEEEDKSEIKIFLSKMYKGYCQVCGYTFRKTNGVNSFERFNWNDKRVVKVKKSFVSTADSLCLCRNCSANIKWGAFYPNFVDTIREIEEFKSKSYDEVREKLHKVVDENIPEIFEPLLVLDDVYTLEIELDGKPRNIYFTNEHLLQFVTYLQKEVEVEEEVEIKMKKRKVKQACDEIYIKNSWLGRDENIPEELARNFLIETIYHPNHSSGRPVRYTSDASKMYMNSYHGWAIDFNSNPFLVGKAIERCKKGINDYIENYTISTKFDLNELKDKLHYHIRGAVATGKNDEYERYYPLEKGRFMKFWQRGIDVNRGVEFLIKEIGLNKLEAKD